MRVIVADGRREVREAVRLLFEQEDIDLVGQAADVDALLAGVARTPADMLLFDWDLSGASGPALVRAVRAIAPTLSVLVMSGRPEVKSLALAEGVEGFVSKADPPERLLRAMGEAAGAGRLAARNEKEGR